MSTSNIGGLLSSGPLILRRSKVVAMLMTRNQLVSHDFVFASAVEATCPHTMTGPAKTKDELISSFVSSCLLSLIPFDLNFFPQVEQSVLCHATRSYHGRRLTITQRHITRESTLSGLRDAVSVPHTRPSIPSFSMYQLWLRCAFGLPLCKNCT